MANAASLQEPIHGSRLLAEAIAVQGGLDLTLETPLLEHGARAVYTAVCELDDGDRDADGYTSSYQECLAGHLCVLGACTCARGGWRRGGGFACMHNCARTQCAHTKLRVQQLLCVIWLWEIRGGPSAADAAVRLRGTSAVGRLG